MPITHDSVEFMNAAANPRRSDESSLKQHGFVVQRTLTEFSSLTNSHHKQRADVRVRDLFIIQCRRLH